MNPIIGITTDRSTGGDYFLRRQYCTAILRAGGIPILLPPVGRPHAALGICDGILLSGGGDISPTLCGISEYDPMLLFEPCPERDEYELELTRLAYERKLPILGICRGIQMLAVALGGTLHFHVSGHSQKLSRDQPSHGVSITAGTRLHELVGTDELQVNSFHHQAVKALPSVLSVSAVSEDGITEAVEASDRHFCLGVQWHPEHMDTRAAGILFAAFCAAADCS